MAAGFLLAASALLSPAQAQAPAAKPNILFIMGDDIGWMQPSIYHRGLMVGETPNIDRIGQEAPSLRTITPSRAAPPGATRSSPACQAPEAYNLDGIIAEMKASRTASHAGE